MTDRPTTTDPTPRRVAELTIALALETPWSHVWWADQLERSWSSGVFDTFERFEEVVRKCAQHRIPPLLIVDLVNRSSR